MCWWSSGSRESLGWIQEEEENDDDDVIGAVDKDMESLKTQYLPSIGENRSFQVQSANLRRTPSTPQRHRPSTKILELTPLWEQVLRYNRLPQNVEKVEVFSELATRLTDPEWEVRQHAMRVLVDLIPVLASTSNDLDSLMIPVVLTEVTYNLGHSAPAVRKSALDVLSVYVKQSSDSEFVLRSIVTQGLESPAASNSLTQSVIICIPALLQDTIAAAPIISHQSLVHIVTALSKKLVQTSFQHQAVSSMTKIRDLIGETRFDHFLESYYPQVKRDFDILCKVYEVHGKSDLGDSGIDLQVQTNTTQYKEEEEWSDRMTLSPAVQTSSTSTGESQKNENVLFTRNEESFKDNSVVDDNYESTDSDVSIREESTESDDETKSGKVKDVDSIFGEITINEVEQEEDFIESSRVVLETEIKFDSERAITMTILEEKNEFKEDGDDGDERYTNDFVMQVLEDNEDGTKRTPRRVRFGGEVVKLRTPDSDVTIEIREEIEDPVSETMEDNLLVDKEPVKEKSDLSVSGKESILYRREEKKTRRRPRSSHIPLPISPAISRPQDPWKKHREIPEHDSPIPNNDGGESLTSGSDGDPPMPRLGFRETLVAEDWQMLGFIDAGLRESLLKKDDWRIRVQGLDRLTSSLQLPEVARFVSISGKKGSISLLQFLVRCLHDDRSQRVICSTLRAVRALLQALSTLDCVTELQATVPALCRHLGGGVSVAVKLEAVAAVKTLMRTVRPGPVVEILFSDKCFESRSSKLRENSLLCLMYALMTFPSTEFNCTHLAQRVMKNSFNEPKRRVRQSILDCLAVLAQFVPRSHLRLDMSDIAQTDHNDALFFLEALHARLIRRTLPTVSPEGLILYAIQISGVHTGADIEWIMAGTGVLSSGSAHSRTQLDNAQRAFISPTENDSASSKRSWSSQDMLVSGVGMNNITSPYTEIEDLKGKQEDSNVASPWVNDARQNQTYGQSRERFLSLLYRQELKMAALVEKQEEQQRKEQEDKKIHYSFSNGYSIGRPLYLKFQINQNDGGYGTHDQGFPKLNTSYGSTNISRRQATSDPMNQTWPAITNTSPNKLSTRRLAMLEPLENQYGYYTQPTPPPHVSINPSSLPPLVQQEWRTGYRSGLYDDHYYKMDVQRTIQYDDRKQNRWSKRQEPEGQRRPGMNNSGDRENGILHKPVLARQNKFSPVLTNGVIPSPVHVIPTAPTPPREDVKVETEELHNHDLSATSSIHSYQVPSAASETKEEKEEMEKVSSDITPLPSLHQEPLQMDLKDVDDVDESKTLDVTDDVKEDMSQDITTPLSSIDLEVLTTEEKIQGDGQEDVPSFEESQAPEEVTPVVVDLEQTEPEPKDKTPVVSPKKSSSRIIGKPRLRLRRPTVKDQQTDTSSSIYPDTMPPYEHPKEAVSKCLLQLENPDWEVTLQGLQGIVRLSRHHTAFLTPALHPVAVTVTKHIRNLRSQVSRAACQAATQLFKSFGRTFEGEVDELAGALFNRTADTNKFLRADCNAALDTMIDNISPVKSINAVVNRGVKHQNAVVRTSACRLLLKLNEHLGPERTLSLPRDTRDAFLISSARFLTEGSLDTRRYAKEIFGNLAQDNRLPSIMAEVVPSSIMRNISKVLTRLGAK